ncbi:MAG: ABC transporter ATP-binding protein [Dethiobacter sp.]|jgi:putative ABC transport system ATP-binding protein|nr:ABC transporter ATP-binding protein [Dethiobacter sp.]
MFEFIDVKFKEIIDLPALCFERKKITTLIGASGSGKTTILKMLNKMLSPTHGRIIYNHTDLRRINSVAHRRQVAMLSQNPAIFEGNIRENLLIGLKLQEKDLPGDDAVLGVMEQVKLNKPLDSPVYTLSGGEKQRLALGRILLLNPEVYLLDEPSAALDENTEEMIMQMVTGHVRKKNKTLVMVTHSKAIAEQYADTVIEIVSGRCFRRGENNERDH